MRGTILLAIGLLPALCAPPTFAAADAMRGKTLHDKLCLGCHVKQYGGDGSAIYLRSGRLIHNRKALDQRVATCNAMTNAGLFPDDEADIAAYLAQRFYKFDK
jgi:cytochrome c5